MSRPVTGIISTQNKQSRDTFMNLWKLRHELENFPLDPFIFGDIFNVTRGWNELSALGTSSM